MVNVNDVTTELDLDILVMEGNVELLSELSDTASHPLMAMAVEKLKEYHMNQEDDNLFDLWRRHEEFN